jgi:hypothetical protein
MSAPASLHSVTLDKGSEVEPIQPDENVNEYEDAEKNFQPKSFKFWAIVIGMYVSIFLVALVRFGYSLHEDLTILIYLISGSNNNCDCNTENY